MKILGRFEKIYSALVKFQAKKISKIKNEFLIEGIFVTKTRKLGEIRRRQAKILKIYTI